MKKGKNLLMILTAGLLSVDLASCGTSSVSISDSSSNEQSSVSETGATSSSSVISGSSSSSSSSHSYTGGGTSGGGTSGGSTSSATYGAVKEFTSDATETDQTYASASADESAVLVKTSGVSATLVNPTVTKSGDTSSADNSSFYGQNASLLATNGTLNVKGGKITSTGEGGAGLCGYSSGVVNASGVTVTTSENAAGGLHACGGGTVNAWNMDISTQGQHSAAIRSDRGGGTMRVDGGTYKSTGAGSPAIYSTADIAVIDATLKATGSEAASIEGDNSIRLFDCSLTGVMPDSSENDNTWGIILYQSMSGDSEVGTAEFAMVGGSLDVQNGGFFHTNSTNADFLIDDVNLEHTNNDSFEYLIRCCGNSRWNSGAGSDCNFTCVNQEMEGKVIYDSASKLDLYLTQGTKWTGESAVSTTYTGSNESSIYIDADSTWVVDGDSQIDNLYNAGTIVDSDGKTVSIVANGTKVVSGTSSYTVTVESSYKSSSDVSAALEVPLESTYTQTKPSVLA